MKKTIAILLLFAFVAQGCGTIVHGTRQNVVINSNPSEALATVGNYAKVKTPAILSLSRTNDYTVTVEKEGYEPAYTNINRSFNGVATILGNILWLIPGVIVDFVAGGAWSLEPENINVNLSKKNIASENVKP